MGAILDYITAAIIFGVLALNVARIQLNLNATLYKNTFTTIAQSNAVQLAEQIEHEFLKIGHHVSGQKILTADSSRIQFKADVLNDNNIATIEYWAGTTEQASSTTNPYDFPLFRMYNSIIAEQNYGTTNFSLSYYDSTNTLIPTPITGSNLDRIKSIRVKFTIQSHSPVISLTDTTYASVNWEKLIFPRNLSKIAY